MGGADYSKGAESRRHGAADWLNKVDSQRVDVKRESIGRELERGDPGRRHDQLLGPTRWSAMIKLTKQLTLESTN